MDASLVVHATLALSADLNTIITTTADFVNKFVEMASDSHFPAMMATTPMVMDARPTARSKPATTVSEVHPTPKTPAPASNPPPSPSHSLDKATSQEKSYSTSG